MAHVLCLVSAAVLFSALFCDAKSPTCQKQFQKKVGDKVEFHSCSTSQQGLTTAYWKYGDEKIVVKDSQSKPRMGMGNTTLILSGLTLQDSGEYSFISGTEISQNPTIIFTLRVYEAITNIKVRKINSTWDSDANTCDIWLECTALHSESGSNYTWAIGNETYTGATFKYVTPEVEDTVKCTVSNPVSEESASIQVECSNSTHNGDGSPHQGPTSQQFWIYISTGLGVLVLVLVLVFVCRRKRRKTEPEATETIYDTIEIAPRKETRSTDELTLGPLYDMVNNVEARPPQQKSATKTIYYTVQQGRLIDPSS